MCNLLTSTFQQFHHHSIQKISLKTYKKSHKIHFAKYLKTRQPLVFRFMAEKKVAKKSAPKKTTKAKTTKKASSKTTKGKEKSTKSKTKKPQNEPMGDGGIVIVDDDITIDQEKVNEERRAYLEEARSQEAFD